MSEDVKKAIAMRRPENSVPLRGFVQDESDGAVWIADRVGTWIVRREDIVATDDWEGVDARFNGRPQTLYVRDGAEIHEVRSTTISIQDRPLSLALGDCAGSPAPPGKQELDLAAIRMRRHLGFEPWDTGGTALGYNHHGGTVCCYETGSWGVDCSGDDCG